MLENRLSFSEFIQNLMSEIIQADAEMQIRQRAGWMEFNNGYPLAEGMDRLENLGLTEVKLTFWVKHINNGFFARLLIAFRYLFRKTQPVACEFDLGGIFKKPSFEVTVTVCRSQDGSFYIKTEPESEALQNVSVSDILS